LELKPEYPDAYNNIRYRILLLFIDYDQAIEALLKGIELKPSYQLAKNNLGNAME